MSFPRDEQIISDRMTRRIVLAVFIALAGFCLWASIFELDEVAVGEARIVPSSRTQQVQSVNGGRVLEIRVSEGDSVARDQVLAVLDPVIAEATVEETRVKLSNNYAIRARLDALRAGTEQMERPKAVTIPDAAWKREVQLFEAERETHSATIRDLEQELELANQELSILETLGRSGGSNQLERLRVQQRVANLVTRLNETRNGYLRDINSELNEVVAEIEELETLLRARQNILHETEIRAPYDGVIQRIHVSASGGGVVPPNGTLFDIVPSGGSLLIDAKFSPRDVAFIVPGQRAMVKISAFDFPVFGGLEATVLRISPDSTRDEVRQNEFYFSVELEADQDYLTSPDGEKKKVAVGMLATVDVRTGRRSIMSYLLKPLIRGGEALRER